MVVAPVVYTYTPLPETPRITVSTTVVVTAPDRYTPVEVPVISPAARVRTPPAPQMPPDDVSSVVNPNRSAVPDERTPYVACAKVASVRSSAPPTSTTRPYQVPAAVPLSARNATSFPGAPCTEIVPAAISSTRLLSSPEKDASDEANRTSTPSSMVRVAPESTVTSPWTIHGLPARSQVVFPSEPPGTTVANAEGTSSGPRIMGRSRGPSPSRDPAVRARIGVFQASCALGRYTPPAWGPREPWWAVGT